MRKVFVPAMLALAFVASTSSNASAFGHLAKLLGHNSCDACCDVEPACGCEIAAPACGCEVVDPCCNAPRLGLLHKLFHKHNGCCDSGCDMGCAAPACGYVEPACGCEIAAPSCGCDVNPCCGPKHKIGGFLKKLFHKHNNCGCEVYEPACGCEPSCGFEAAPSCGCGS